MYILDFQKHISLKLKSIYRSMTFINVYPGHLNVNILDFQKCISETLKSVYIEHSKYISWTLKSVHLGEVYIIWTLKFVCHGL